MNQGRVFATYRYLVLLAACVGVQGPHSSCLHPVTRKGFPVPSAPAPPSTASSVGPLSWLRLPGYQHDGLRPCFLRAQSAGGNSHPHDPNGPSDQPSPVPSAQVRIVQQVPCVSRCPFCRHPHLSWGSPSVGLEGWGCHPSGVFGRRERPQCPR